jgi:uncharacterized protein YuzE
MTSLRQFQEKFFTNPILYEMFEEEETTEEALEFVQSVVDVYVTEEVVDEKLIQFNDSGEVTGINEWEVDQMTCRILEKIMVILFKESGQKGEIKVEVRRTLDS